MTKPGQRGVRPASQPGKPASLRPSSEIVTHDQRCERAWLPRFGFLKRGFPLVYAGSFTAGDGKYSRRHLEFAVTNTSELIGVPGLFGDDSRFTPANWTKGHCCHRSLDPLSRFSNHAAEAKRASDGLDVRRHIIPYRIRQLVYRRRQAATFLGW